MNESSMPFQFMTRRRFLAMGAVGAGALLAGGGGLLALRGRAPRVAGLKVLSAQDYRTLSLIAQAHIPRGGPFEEGAADFDLARVFDAFAADEPKEAVAQIKRAITLFEYGPLLFERRPVTFSNLSPDERLEHWRGWLDSERLLRRQVASGFQKLFSMVFYDRPEIWKHIDYDGPVLPLWGYDSHEAPVALERQPWQ